jgi:2-phosphosulfolactate phosphatase
MDVNVFPLPQLFEPEELSGGVAVVLDVLRATTTILTALANGAARVIPCGDIERARQAAALCGETALTGGERGGVAIPGFDLDNSPASYAAERVRAKTVVLTTTNGTAALLRSRSAARILIGALVNRRALTNELRRERRNIHLVCAGTDGRVTAEDLLAAGAIAVELEVETGRSTSRDDLTQVAKALWREESASSERLLAALRASRGGRNLVELGFDADIELAAQVDSLDLVGEYFPKTGSIEAVPPLPVQVTYGP